MSAADLGEENGGETSFATRPRTKFCGTQAAANEFIRQIVTHAGIAWSDPEYAPEQNHFEDVFQGYRVSYFTKEDVMKWRQGE